MFFSSTSSLFLQELHAFMTSLHEGLRFTCIDCISRLRRLSATRCASPSLTRFSRGHHRESPRFFLPNHHPPIPSRPCHRLRVCHHHWFGLPLQIFFKAARVGEEMEELPKPKYTHANQTAGTAPNHTVSGWRRNVGSSSFYSLQTKVIFSHFFT